ncbi:EAL domain-containing protein [Roseibium sp.]|uniref:EAL domain-containing protein n=1 Tax=Roseibium sp. TaxID=1936156 RepID=UPI003A975C0C
MATVHRVLDEAGSPACSDQPLTVSQILDATCYAFQPIADFGTGVVYGYEALLRHHESLGFGTHAELFDAAWESGILPELEAALLAAALDAYSKLPTARGTKLFFNLDGRDLGAGEDRRVRLGDIVTSKGFSPTQVCLELCETHRNGTSEITDHVLNNLRRTGFMFVLDDFGKGFSELRLIHDLGPDYIKIDRFFLNGIETDARRKLFVTTVANLAHVLGARVIAEGVETEREFKACRDAGCDLVQGFYVAEPFIEKRDARLFYDHVRVSSMGTTRKEEERRIRNELQQLSTVNHDGSMSTLLDMFLTDQEVSLVPVIDANNEPRGLIHERDLKAYLYAGGFGEDDYHAALDLPLRNFVRSCPIADIDSNADMLLVTFASSLNSDGIIITENFRYAGFLSATSLLKIIHERRLEEAQDQNPLTRLPGNGAINRFIKDAAKPRPAPRHFCYFDFDNFKPFNDTYGYRQGDRAIILFSELMQQHLTGTTTFRGHIGGDDFFAGFMNGDQTEIATQLLSLKRAFKSDVESFYSAEHRECGYIEAADRFGSPRLFSLLDCSISMMTLESNVALAPDQVTAEIAELKRAAKRSDDGIAVKTISG